MKTLRQFSKTFFLMTFFVSVAAQATVDYSDQQLIVVQDMHSEEFSTQAVPFIGCAGIPVYCDVEIFTFDYKIPQGGCGEDFRQDHSLNLLSCARFEPVIAESDESGAVFEQVVKADLILDGCETQLGGVLEAKSGENKKLQKTLIRAITKAFDSNFPHAKALHIRYKGQSIN